MRADAFPSLILVLRYLQPAPNQVLILPSLQPRTLDPIFAVSVGCAAAVVRINREEKEKGKSFEQTKESLGRRAEMAWKIVRGEIEGEKASAGTGVGK